MRTSGQIFLVVALLLGSALPAKAKVKLVVTKEVLVEYIEDRFSRLEGKEKLDEEETAELTFIRENRHNLQALADFFRMKIKEMVPERVSVRKGPSPRKIQGKSVKEISQSRPHAPDTVRLEKERRPIEATLPETSEPEEKSGEFALAEEMAGGKRAEKVEGKIAKKDMKGDEKAISPGETYSPLVKSETAITAQKSIPPSNQLKHTKDLKDTKALNEYDAPSDLKDKGISLARLPTDPNSSIEVEEPIVQPKAPSLIATEEEVRQFFVDYTERYTQKNVDGLLSLFSPKAVQNQRDSFDEIKKTYSDFFDKSQELWYHMEDMKIDIYQNAVEARGRYEVNRILKKRGKKEAWKGDIRWILVRENGALRIRFLDFRSQKSQ